MGHSARRVEAVRGPYEFVAASRLDAPAERIWEHATTPEGVNDELWPLVRMTHPADVGSFTPETVVPGERLFRSWILLFGVLPIDYDDITLVRIEPGRGFLERSPMASQRLWEHERRLEPDGDGCLVLDRVRHEPRVALGGRLQSIVFSRFFLHRHRRLRRRFGGEPA